MQLRRADYPPPSFRSGDRHRHTWKTLFRNSGIVASGIRELMAFVQSFVCVVLKPKALALEKRQCSTCGNILRDEGGGLENSAN